MDNRQFNSLYMFFNFHILSYHLTQQYKQLLSTLQNSESCSSFSNRGRPFHTITVVNVRNVLYCTALIPVSLWWHLHLSVQTRRYLLTHSLHDVILLNDSWKSLYFFKYLPVCHPALIKVSSVCSLTWTLPQSSEFYCLIRTTRSFRGFSNLEVKSWILMETLNIYNFLRTFWFFNVWKLAQKYWVSTAFIQE